MTSFDAGLIIGCLVGVMGTYLLLLLAASVSGVQPDKMNGQSRRRAAIAVVALLLVSGVSYALKLDKAYAILLLFLSVLVIAKLEGFKCGFLASGVAAALLSFLFLPPVGSLWVIGTDNRLVLALFLLITTVGSRLIGARKSLPG